ncbi:MAG: DUF547 domain-containing protein [Gemmatimonadota bacterium]
MAAAALYLRFPWAVLRARSRRPPRPAGSGRFDHSGLRPALAAVRHGGLAALAAVRGDLEAYRSSLADVDPDALTRDGALAFWIDAYNAGALSLALEARDRGVGSVRDVVGGFDRPRARVAGERLSLNDIEHGKIRRFHDPRVHAALVCGSLSCPSLPPEPVDGEALHPQLEAAMRAFLAGGAAVPDRERGEVRLSRVFRWFGSDFVRPEVMPGWRPVSGRRVLAALAPWLDEEDRAWIADRRPTVRYLPYDWALGCRVG